MRGELPPDPERIFRASLVDAEPDDLAAEAARFRPAFRHLALLVQVPGVDLEARMEAEKGAPLDDAERAILERARRRRARVAGRVRARPLPGRGPSDGLPAEASRARRGAARVPGRPGRCRGRASDRPPATPGRTSSSAPPRRAAALGEAFGAIYLAFLGRPNGPRAGWLLASLEPGFVVARLRAAAAQVGAPMTADAPSAEVGA